MGMRLDSRLVTLGLASSRARAKELICGGQITVFSRPCLQGKLLLKYPIRMRFSVPAVSCLLWAEAA